MVKIIWLHVPEIKPYMVETQNFVKSLEKLGYNVIDGITPSNLAHAIWKPLNEHWLTDDIIIIGQDNVPTLKMIEIVVPPFNMCISNFQQTRMATPILAIRKSIK